MHEDDVVTVSVRRGELDITVEFDVRRTAEGVRYEVSEAVDERGRPVKLTTDEYMQALRMAYDGADETGR